MSLDTAEFVGQEKTIDVSFSQRDLIIYALGIGETDLRYTYEHADGFGAFPTFPIVLPFKGTATDVVGFPSDAMADLAVMPPLEGVRVLLDGERFLSQLAPLPTDGRVLKMSQKLIGVQKKGKGALVTTEQVLRDPSNGQVLVRMVSGAFLVGATNFKDAGSSPLESVTVPKRTPDAVVEQTTSPHQAQLYRLSGDYNPLHVDPSFAQMSGFKAPILHGLCTMGHAARAVLSTFGDNDASRFSSVRVRFAKPVMPGETLVTYMWKEGNRVLFAVKVKETDNVVVSNAYMDLKPKAAM